MSLRTTVKITPEEAITLGFDDYGEEVEIVNPFLGRTEEDVIDPMRFYLKEMQKPENFYFVCKYFLNVLPLAFQLALLKGMWNRTFPMLIASRGGGKSFILALYAVLRAFLKPGTKVILVGAVFRQAKQIFEYCERIYNNAPILREVTNTSEKQGVYRDQDRWTLYIGDSTITAIPMGDGCVNPLGMVTYKDGFGYISRDHDLEVLDINSILRDETIYGNGEFRYSDEAVCVGKKPTKIITTKKGFSYESTLNHKMKLLRKGKVEWVMADEVEIGDSILIDKSERWHNGNFNCTSEQAYALGLMIGDGCWTNKDKLGFATKDIELIEKLELGLGLSFKTTSDRVHYNNYGQENHMSFVNFWKLQDLTYAKDKTLPPTILSASKENMTSCIRGLFDTDGTIQLYKKDNSISFVVSFTNTSEKLIDQLHYILLHYGIVATKRARKRDKKWSTAYELTLYGKNSIKFLEQIGFGLSRKQAIYNDNKYLKKRNISILGGKDDNIYYDTITSIKNSSSVCYDVHIPETHEYCMNGFFSHNTTIRGLRANVVIADEFAFLTADVYETVVEGFTATNQDVISEVQKANLLELLYKRGEITKERKKELESGGGNQSIIAGTAEFQLNHFYSYWTKYTGIIRSRGNEQKLREAMKDTEPDEDFDWRDYAVYRIPYNIIPRGLLSGKAIARAKATLTTSNFLKEYAACFPRDSQGYYPRSLIDSCVTRVPIELPISGKVQFNASLKGDPNLSYIIGVDPASESDNFAIVVLECHLDHRRVVYSWTVKRKKHKEYYEQGKTDEFDFFNFCARKIRTLMELFPNVISIGIDKQGGGVAIMEALGDSKNLDKDKGELPIFLKIDPDPSKRKLTDGMAGLHIIEEINFSKEEWRVGANQGMKFDLENKNLLFPAFNPSLIVQAMESDSRRGKNRNSNLTYESLEDCILDIEELKNELTTIVHTQTETGKDKWSTPEIKLEGGKKGRMVKDRYTALLIANMVGRQLQLAPSKPDWSNTGAGVAQQMHVRDKGGRHKMYSGNEWYNQFMENVASIQEQMMYERGQL